MDDADALPATSTEIINQSSSAPLKDLLSIPATSAASERAFTVGKDIFGISRMSLKPETVEALICLRSWYKAGLVGVPRYYCHGLGKMSEEVFKDCNPCIIDYERYNVRMRSQAIQIFTNLTESVCSAGEYNKALVKHLQEPDGPASDVGLKTAIVKALTVLVKHVPKQLSQWLLQILPTVWNTLTHSAHVYVACVVNETEESDEQVDPDGEVISFENLVSSIFEFVHALVETPRFRSAVRDGISQIIYYIILFMQIMEEQISTWTGNPDRFVEDESEDSFSYSVRLAAQDLLLALRQEFEDEACSGLCEAVTRHLQEAEVMHTQGNSSFWWKVVEAALLSLGVVKDLLESQQKENQLPLVIVVILQSSLDQHNRMAGKSRPALQSPKNGQISKRLPSAGTKKMSRQLHTAATLKKFVPSDGSHLKS
ncbi:hypothetical protein DAPPUDRAFT_228557 [Daphnia pulex]|uniref:HAT C-terminal dimerisation domain-containing protein n=1 Tax=Daphnia pulex TaxID=6669 RepID=E9HEU2_DAPPU|nr:hypothetical protein DAPPUDRAFT_228557 [Daphnia pulex]|eukprot:EFX69752.1 hypothetical protein DAPPUDRAFT_228557 [Daphnia pulex]